MKHLIYSILAIAILCSPSYAVYTDIYVVYAGTDTLANVKFPLLDEDGYYIGDTTIERVLGGNAGDSAQGVMNWDTPYLTIQGAYTRLDAEANDSAMIWVLKYGTNDTPNVYTQGIQFAPTRPLKIISNQAEWYMNNINKIIDWSDADYLEMYNIDINFENCYNQPSPFVGSDTVYINYNTIRNIVTGAGAATIYFSTIPSNGSKYNESQFKDNYVYNIRGRSDFGIVLHSFQSTMWLNNVYDSVVCPNTASDQFITNSIYNNTFTNNYLVSSYFDNFTAAYSDTLFYDNYLYATTVLSNQDGCTTILADDMLTLNGDSYVFNVSTGGTIGFSDSGAWIHLRYPSEYDYTDTELAGIISCGRFSNDSEALGFLGDFWDVAECNDILYSSDSYYSDSYNVGTVLLDYDTPVNLYPIGTSGTATVTVRADTMKGANSYVYRIDDSSLFDSIDYSDTVTSLTSNAIDVTVTTGTWYYQFSGSVDGDSISAWSDYDTFTATAASSYSFDFRYKTKAQIEYDLQVQYGTATDLSSAQLIDAVSKLESGDLQTTLESEQSYTQKTDAIDKAY